MLQFTSSRKSPTIQPKLQVGPVNDHYEQEADRVADQVVRGANTDSAIQRKCADCEGEQLQMKSARPHISPMQRTSEGQGGNLQMKGNSGAAGGLEQQLQTSKGSGSPLSSNVRQQMEEGIGADFSNVKVHHDSQAAQMNQQLNARAFTNGSDIYFDRGQFQPESTNGQRLLAHELTHVVQQTGAGNAVQSKSNTIQRYVAYASGDQMKHLSEEDYGTIAPGKEYTERKQKKFDKQTERFNKKYKKQEEKGKISSRNKKRKEGWRHPQKDGLLVSEDGRMVVEDKGKYSIKAWADEVLIDTSNAVLARKKSFITLKKGPADLVIGNVPGTDTPNSYKSSFKRINVVRADQESGGNMTSPKNTEREEYSVYNKDQEEKENQTLKFRDCGKANRLIIGSLQAEGNFARYYKTSDGLIAVQTGDVTKTIKAFIQKIMEAEFPDDERMKDQKLANVKYESLSSAEKARINKKYGLDAAARPALGQGVTTAATDYKENAMNADGTSRGGFNFHFGSNIVESSTTSDYISLEGLANHENWFFKMYGNKKGQSFHEKTTGIVQGPNMSTVVDQ